jgi:hypothetical protein
MITGKHRIIYQQHYGSIPKDNNGRSFDVHHIDGNHANNDPKNLVALSISDHYDVHLEQEDWGACRLLAERAKKSPEEIFDLQRKIGLARYDRGDCVFANTELQSHFGKIGANKLLCQGIHNFQKKSNKIKIRNWQKQERTCPHCGKVGKGSVMSRHHFERCKEKNDI